MKGLSELGLGEKVIAEKLIKESLKISMKNSKVWHFYALFHKEQKNYAQAVKCYMFANKYEPDNLNIIKDLSNLLLYLGHFEDFSKYSLQCVTIKSSLSVNWIQYSLAEYFLKHYEKALQHIDSVLKNFEDTMKKQEMHEVLVFKSNILFKLNRYEECIAEHLHRLTQMAASGNTGGLCDCLKHLDISAIPSGTPGYPRSASNHGAGCISGHTGGIGRRCARNGSPACLRLFVRTVSRPEAINGALRSQ